MRAWAWILAACGAPPPADTASAVVEVHAKDAAENAGVTPQPAQLPGPGPAEAVAHLAGCWEAQGAPADTWLVQYTHPVGGLVVGVTRHFRADTLLFDEVERFSVGPDGRFGVTPIAEGQPRARFVLDPTQSAPGKAVFVNPENQWPTAIRYERQGDRLDVIAEGGDQALAIGLRPAGCR